MSERVYFWRPSSLGRPIAPLFQGLAAVEVAWSSRHEAFTPPNDETPLHMIDRTQVPLEDAWLVFLDDSFAGAPAPPLAVMLDYARYYGLRTAGLFRSGGAAPGPETYALDLALVGDASAAERLGESWRAHDLDMSRTPAIREVSGLAEVLKSAPPVSRLLALSGSASSSDEFARACAAEGVLVRRLRWNVEDRALHPAADDDALIFGGDLRGEWSVLTLSSCRDGAEAMEIVDEAGGLGLKLAIAVGAGKLDPEFGRLTLPGADLVLFDRAEQREAMLAEAFSRDDKIALLRERWRVAADARAALAEIRARRARTNLSGRLARPEQIYVLASGGGGGVAAELLVAIERPGLGVEPLVIDAGAETPRRFDKQWLLIGDDPSKAQIDCLERAKAGGIKVAVVYEGGGAARSESSASRAFRLADVILPASWRAAAELIRALALAGLPDARIIPCVMPRDRGDWSRYAGAMVEALAKVAAAPGWPLEAVTAGAETPLLTCAITTYNRAPWLKHSLKRLLDAAAPWGGAVEIVVCDNASTDDTPKVAEELLKTHSFRYFRNPANVGMLGNLGATARHCKGAYVWIVGDDDLVVAEGLETIVKGLEENPDVEMAYLNYGYTRFNEPETLSDATPIIDRATPIGFGGDNRRVERLADVAAFNENLFTAIYACVFRRDHALRAYQLDTRGAPFSSLPTCVPSSVYALSALQDRPAYWVGFPAIVVNMNVSWMRWALLWHLERMPDLHDLSELAGIDPARIDRHRFKHCWNAGEWARETYFEAEEAIRAGFSVARLIERCKHIEVFRTREIFKVMEVYRKAWDAGCVTADVDPPEALFARYGFALGETVKIDTPAR